MTDLAIKEYPKRKLNFCFTVTTVIPARMIQRRALLIAKKKLSDTCT